MQRTNIENLNDSRMLTKTDVLKLEESDFIDLIESRVLLEIQAARTAAERRTIDDIIGLRNALDNCETKVRQGLPAVEEDFLFHLRIADAGQNSVLKSLMMILTPDIIKNYLKLEICENGRFYRSLAEHKIILEHIVNQEPELAAKAMKDHLEFIMEYCQR